ncbi:hypothetical protein KM043_004246 [Ampulex compressa]|nr:hypothetical protein KM043_004246 [Ampulex compressa]
MCNAEKRVEEMFRDVVFDRLKKEVPTFRTKVTVVFGDYLYPNLAITANDQETLQQSVSIVFNLAAVVRFDERLRKAIDTNVSATKALMELCTRMRNLQVVVHVSTAYSNCNRKSIDETFYDPPLSADTVIGLVQGLNDKELDVITHTLLGNFTNTYVYTKCIAEDLVREYGKRIPIGIFRPAMVISTYKEPVEGWTDKASGPTEGVAAGAFGLIRVLQMDKSCVARMVPSDYTVNALIAATWDAANRKNEGGDPPIYNYLSPSDNVLTWGRYVDLTVKYGTKLPLSRSIWCYSLAGVKQSYLYLFLITFLHLLPGLFIDLGLLIAGKKPRLLRLYRKIHKYTKLTSYFTTNSWNFSHDNMKNVWHNLCAEDKERYFFYTKNFDWEDYMDKYIRGIRLYFFKDQPNTIPFAKKRMARFVLLHNTVKYSTFLCIGWLLYCTAHAVAEYKSS